MGMNEEAEMDQTLSDEEPPHVKDDTPLDAPRPLRARIFVRRFRSAAANFRNPTGPLEKLHLGNERYAEYPKGLKDHCGEWLSQARHAGLIPAEQQELIELIDWHAGENPEGLPP